MSDKNFKQKNICFFCCEKMLWSTIFILLFAIVNSYGSFVNNQNWFNKINIENHGKKYINIYAFFEIKFIMEILEPQNFNFTIKKQDSKEVIPIHIIFSTASLSMNVLCDAKAETWTCLTSSEPVTQVSSSFFPLSNGDIVKLYQGYNARGLNFLQDDSKYFLKVSSNFTPVENQNLCTFLMEWPSTVTLQKPDEIEKETETEKPIPPNYEMCEESEKCEKLKNENGVKFVRKGTVEFTMAILEKEKVYNLLYKFGYNSPIFKIRGSHFCTEYTTKISFNDLGYILFKRDREKIDIQTAFKSSPSAAFKNMPIARNSNITFYFYENFVYCNFFDPNGNFQMRTFKLPEGMTESLKEDSTNIKINHTNVDSICIEKAKLIIGDGVKLLFPKNIPLASTIEPPPTNLTETNNSSAAVNSTKEDSEAASFPIGAIIAISCVGVLLLLGCLVLIIYCGFKKYKKQKNAKMLPSLDPSINTMNPRKSKNHESSKNSGNEIFVINDKSDAAFELPKQSSDEKGNVGLKIKNNANEKEVKAYIKPPRFDPKFVEKLVPAASNLPLQYYEENPKEDDKIDYETIKRPITITDDFWALFPFLQISNLPPSIKSGKIVGALQASKNRQFQYQFIIRDLSLPENKIFHEFGARLFEPIIEEIVSEKEGCRPNDLEPVAIRIFILCKDPPTIECIVHGRFPKFFTAVTKCKECQFCDKPRFFDPNHLSRISQCLRELPLGHHINILVGQDRRFRFNSTEIFQIKSVFAVKGGQQIVPLNLKYSSYAHPNGFRIQAKKKTAKSKTPIIAKKLTKTEEEENNISNEISKKTEGKTKTNTYDRDGTDPTQIISVQTTQNTSENENRRNKKRISKTFNRDSITQASVTAENGDA